MVKKGYSNKRFDLNFGRSKESWKQILHQARYTIIKDNLWSLDRRRTCIDNDVSCDDGDVVLLTRVSNNESPSSIGDSVTGKKIESNMLKSQ